MATSLVDNQESLQGMSEEEQLKLGLRNQEREAKKKRKSNFYTSSSQDDFQEGEHSGDQAKKAKATTKGKMKTPLKKTQKADKSQRLLTTFFSPSNLRS